jgi:hypothetical protein
MKTHEGVEYSKFRQWLQAIGHLHTLAAVPLVCPQPALALRRGRSFFDYVGDRSLNSAV